MSDYFAVFELPVDFAVDGAELERRYLERSRVVHPDRFVNAPASERLASVQRFSQLRDAYQTLRRPVSRAEYMLARAGVTIGDNEQLDLGFLGEILALREELEEAIAAGENGRRAELEAAMRRRRNDAIASLGPLLAASDLAEVKRQLILLRYVERFLEAAAEPDEDDVADGRVAGPRSAAPASAASQASAAPQDRSAR